MDLTIDNMLGGFPVSFIQPVFRAPFTNLGQKYSSAFSPSFCYRNSFDRLIGFKNTSLEKSFHCKGAMHGVAFLSLSVSNREKHTKLFINNKSLHSDTKLKHL